MKIVIFIFLSLPFVLNSQSQWKKIYKTHSNTNLSKIYFYNDNFGLVFDESNNTYITNNGGIDWDSVKINFVDKILINDIKFYNNKIGWIVGGAGLIFKTSDGGFTWKQIDTLYSVTNFSDINKIKIFDSVNVLFAGGFVKPGPAIIYKTTDGGTTLSKIYQVNSSRPEGLKFVDLKFWNEKVGYANIYGRSLHKTEDSGTSWTQIAEAIIFNNIYIKDSLNLIGYGLGSVYYSYNGGYDWEKVFDSKYNISQQTGFILNKTFLVDSSYSWSFSYDVQQQRVFNRVTLDGGKSWRIEHPLLDTNLVFSDIYFSDSQKGWAILDKNIYKTNNGGILRMDETKLKVPNNIKLYQNYPNPFNPKTILKYSIPNGNNIRLNIYDILGKKVAKLVDKYQAKGNYSIEFDASYLSSGIYYYSISVDSKHITKKMILMK